VHIMFPVPKNKLPPKRYRDPVKFVENWCRVQDKRIRK
jgi:hypothetical protein